MAGIGSRLIAAMLAAAGALAMAVPAEAFETPDVCGAETRRQERHAGIPDGLLTAISHVESGRYDKGARALIAWPWTVMAEGKGRYLPSKAAAIAEVMALKARGVRNIDVGCMQVNLQVHGHAFADLGAAFDPRTNIAYAARFLTELQAETGSWATAGTHYHSRTPHLAARYRLKLATAWGRLQDQGSPPGRIGGPGSDRAMPIVYRPLPVTVQRAASRFAEQAAQRKQELAAEREQARKAADAWRQQKLSEYHTRKVQQQNKGGIPVRP
jgi:hypothetical protein